MNPISPSNDSTVLLTQLLRSLSSYLQACQPTRPDSEIEMVLPSSSLHLIRGWTRNYGFGSYSEFTKGYLLGRVAVVDVLMFNSNLLLLIVNVCILCSLKCTLG